MTYWNPVLRRGVDALRPRPRGHRRGRPDHARPHPRRGGRLDRRHRRARPRPGLPRRAQLDPASASSTRRPPAAASSTPPRSWASPAPAATVGSAAESLVARTREVTDLPVCVGLGVSTGAQAAEVGGVRRRRHRRVRPGAHARRGRHPRRGHRPSPGPRRRPRRRGPAQPRKGDDVMMLTALPLEIPSPTRGSGTSGRCPSASTPCASSSASSSRSGSPSRRLATARRQAGPGPRRRGLGRPVRHRRRPALPRHHHARRPTSARAATRGRVQGLGGRPRHLGRHRARRAGRLDRLPARTASASSTSPTRRRPGSPSRRPSAGSATGSTTSSTAAPTTCRGACRIYEWDPSAGRASSTPTATRWCSGVFHPTFLYEAIFLRPARRGLLVCRPPARFAPRPDLRALRGGLPGRAGRHRDHAHRRRRTTSSACGSTSWTSASSCSCSGGLDLLVRPTGRRTRRSPRPTRSPQPGRVSTFGTSVPGCRTHDATDILTPHWPTPAQPHLMPSGTWPRSRPAPDLAVPWSASETDDREDGDHDRDRRPLLRPARRQPACTAASTSTTPAAWPWSRRCAGSAGHDIVDHALDALRNLDHRGATGADPLVGDGAGILTQVPDAFLRAVVDFAPARRPARTPSAWPSCPIDDGRARATAEAGIERDRRRGGPARPRLARRAGHRPTSSAEAARECMPHFRQLFVASAGGRLTGIEPRPVRLLPAQARRARGRGLLPVAVGAHPGLQGHADDRPARAVLPRPVRPSGSPPSSRWSTRASRPTPSRRWPLAHPYRLIAHNGEINTVKGNRNWMQRPREPARLRPHPRRPRAALPDLHPRRLRLGDLRRGARAAPPRRPVAAARGADDDPRGVGEPRDDGPRPAGVLRVPLDLHGAVGRPGLRHLHRRHAHRRGARPQRPAPGPLLGHRRRARRARLRGGRPRPRARPSRAQARPAPAGPDVPRRHRARPHRQRRGGQVLARRRAPLRRVAARRPASSWRTCPSASTSSTPRPRSRGASRPSATPRRSCDPLAPMASTGGEALGSMGTDTPDRRALRAAAAALRLLHPAVRPGDEPAARRDPRGARHLARHRRSAPRATPSSATPAHARQVVLPFPVIDNDELAKIVHINADGDLPGYAPYVVRGLYDVTRRRGRRCAPGSQEIFAEVSAAIAGGARFVVLSDRDSGRDLAPIPSLLLTSAVHHHLIREKTRTQVGLARRGRRRPRGAPRGAARRLRRGRDQPLPRHGVRRGPGAHRRHHRGHRGEGGRQPHQGARQGRAQGDVEDGHLHRGLLPRRPGVRGDRPVAGARRRVTSPARSASSAASASTSSRRRPRPGTRWPTRPTASARRTASCWVGGEYQWRREGEPHLFDPETVFRLQHATRARRYDIFKQYTSPGRRAVRSG